jgi:hypothetical protein
MLIAGRQAAIAMSIPLLANQALKIPAGAQERALVKALDSLLCGTIATVTDAIVTWNHDQKRRSCGHIFRSAI